jgi:hypothetical protein
MSCWLPIIQAGSGRLGGGGGGPVTHEISSLGDVPAGAAEGDLGFVTGSALALQLKELTLPDAETRLQWVLALDYESTITVNAYADGDELEATLAGQGWTTVTSGTSSITTDGTTITLATAAISSGASINTLAGTLTAAQRFRILGEIWGDTPSTADFGYIAAGDTGSNDFAIYNANIATPTGIQPVNSGVNSYLPVGGFAQSGPTYLPSTFTSAAATQLCIIDDGASVGGQMLREGSFYCPVRRVPTGVPQFPNGITLAASSGVSGGAYSLFLRNVLIYTVS